MDNLFSISLNIKTTSGFESFVTYNLGVDKDKAAKIFAQLKGSPNLTGATVLTVDFTEMENGIPLPVNMLECTFDEVLENTKIITREIFKNLNLEQD